MSTAEPKTLEILVKGVTTTKYSGLASLAFLLHDHAITLGDEMFLIWSRDWTYGKILFIFNRYFGLLTLLGDVIVLFAPSLTNQFCERFLRWEILSSVVALVTAGAILASRVHAVYLCNWKVTGVIICAIVGSTTSVSLIDYIDIPDTAALPFGLSGCHLFNLSDHYKYTWIPPLITETVQCGFMLYKAWQLYVDKDDFPLLTLIIRDSSLYFLTVFSVMLVNCLVWVAAPQSLAEVAIGWLVAIPCTIGSRLLLNMRKRYLAKKTIELSFGFTSGTSLDCGPSSQRDGRRGKSTRQLTFTVDEFTISG